MATRPETPTSDYYDILEVSKGCDISDIKGSFGRLVLTRHPDRGGSQESFVALCTAYHTLVDPRKRRLYDVYGPDALERSSESLLAHDVFGRYGAAETAQGVDALKAQVEQLEREKETLQKEMLILRPATENTYATSFEAWLRNRTPEQTQVITSDTLAEQLGVVECTYEPVPIPQLTCDVVRYSDMGELPTACTFGTETLPTELKWGEVLVHILAAPITPLDHRLGQWYSIPTLEPPQRPAPAGSEGVGIVLRVGEGVKTLSERDLVVPAGPFVGTWRQYAVTKASQWRPLPSTSLQSPEALGTIPACCTAYRLLNDYGSLRPGDTIIQSGAETLVGQAVIQLCKVLQIKSINLVADNDEFDSTSDTLQGMGATFVWRDTATPLARVKRAGCDPPRLAFDCMGGDSTKRLADCLRPGSPLVLYHLHGPTTVRFPYDLILYKHLTLHGFWLYEWTRENGEEASTKMLDLILPLMESGQLLPQTTPGDLSDWKATLEGAVSTTVVTFASGVVEALARLPVEPKALPTATEACD